MELNEFVQRSLEQIIDGVQKAQKSKGIHVVNPKHTGEFAKGMKHNAGDLLHDIEFDVAVTVQEKLGADLGAKISVLGIGLGSKIEADNLSSTVTRLKFIVPVSYTDPN